MTVYRQEGRLNGIIDPRLGQSGGWCSILRSSCSLCMNRVPSSPLLRSGRTLCWVWLLLRGSCNTQRGFGTVNKTQNYFQLMQNIDTYLAHSATCVNQPQHSKIPNNVSRSSKKLIKMFLLNSEFFPLFFLSRISEENLKKMSTETACEWKTWPRANVCQIKINKMNSTFFKKCSAYSLALDGFLYGTRFGYGTMQRTAGNGRCRIKMELQLRNAPHRKSRCPSEYAEFFFLNFRFILSTAS